MKLVRAVRTVTSVKRIESTISPKQIDLVEGPPAGTVVLIEESVIVEDGDTTEDSSTIEAIEEPADSLNLGIYELSGDSLRYCFAPPEGERPKEFAVAKGSNHTLVTLKRFYTGEADTIAALEELGADVTLDDGWAVMVSFPEKPLADEKLALLKKLTHLRDVRLAETGITDRGLVHLKEIESLGHIDVRGCPITDAGLKSLRGLSKVQGLWLSGTKITDAGLDHIRDFSLLYNLWLDRTAVTDAGMKKLSDMQGLDWVIIDDTQVTAKGIAELRKIKGLERTSRKD